MQSSRNLLQWLMAVSVLILLQSGLLIAQESFNPVSLGVRGPVVEPTNTNWLTTARPATDTVAARSELLNPFGAAPMAPSAVIAVVPMKEPGTHRFWDRQNRILFTAQGGMAAADFFVTRSNLAKGGKELNPVARMFTGSTPALAANFALETGGTIGISYMFHKTGHHKLERVTSYVNIGGSAAAVAFGLAHR